MYMYTSSIASVDMSLITMNSIVVHAVMNELHAVKAKTTTATRETAKTNKIKHSLYWG